MKNKIITNKTQSRPEFIWACRLSTFNGMHDKVPCKITWDSNHQLYSNESKQSSPITNVIGIDDKWLEDDGELTFSSESYDEVKQFILGATSYKRVFKVAIDCVNRMFE